MDNGQGSIMELTDKKRVIFSSEEVSSSVDNMELEVTIKLIQILSR